MGDNKEYISKIEPEGSINISEDVLSVIAVEAIKEVEGVGGAGAALGKKGTGRSVRVSVVEETVTVDVTVLVKYGYAVNEVARQLQNAVSKAIGDMTGLSVAAVNVTVGGVLFDKDK